MNDLDPQAPAQPVPTDAPRRDDGRVPYFTVGPLKFSLLAFATFGFYELYWFYRNWSVVRRNTANEISPFWRTVFAPLWTFAMGSHLCKRASEIGVRIVLPTAALGIAYLVLVNLWRLPDPYWLVSLFSFVPLIPFDYATRRLNGNGQLSPPTHGRFGGWLIAVVIVGCIVLALAVVGTFLPDDAAPQTGGEPISI